ncbi:MAG: diguanylate cyclase, partial [Thermoanaerobaculia bacterium]
ALRTLVFDSLAEQIAVIDQAGSIVDVNSAWIEFGAGNGLPPDVTWIGVNYLDVLAASAAGLDHHAGPAAQGIQEVLKGASSSFYLEYPCHSPDEQRWFMMRATRLADDSRDFCVVSHQNITVRKLAEERAQHLAMHDSLTGLANRRHFEEVLQREIRRSIRNHTGMSILAIDLDRFKEFNDRLGHAAGDQCLIGAARVIANHTRRAADYPARIGGDEFSVLLAETDLQESMQVAEAIRQGVENLQVSSGESTCISASIGVATRIPTSERDAGLFLRAADTAMYRAKSEGRNRVVTAWPQQDDSAPGIS